MCAPNWTSGLALSSPEPAAAAGDAVKASKTVLMIGVHVYIVSGSDVARSLAGEPVPLTTTNWMKDEVCDAHI